MAGKGHFWFILILRNKFETIFLVNHGIFLWKCSRDPKHQLLADVENAYPTKIFSKSFFASAQRFVFRSMYFLKPLL